MLLGFSPEALLGYLAITQPILMLQHANLNLKSGWLNYIFSTNELHRWHHSTDREKANSNYGNAIVLWDQVFGTFKIGSVADTAESTVGLFPSSDEDSEDKGYSASASYFGQLCPITTRCCGPR